MIHPNDDTGDALRRLEADGDDLTRARNIDFTVVFPDELNAERFAEYFRERGHVVSVERSEVEEGPSWDVTVVNKMAPSHAGIADFENILQEVADTLDGKNDDWGCFAEPAKPPLD
jgi:Regulator of ribonuclease activity B